MVSSIFYVLFTGIFDRINVFTFIAIGLVMLDVLILLLFGWRCPFTILAEKYTDNHETGFDLFVPVWLAGYNKTIFGTIFGIGLIVVILRLLEIV